MKCQLIRKEDPDAGKVGRQEKKATTENEMVGWHHGLDGLVFEQALGDGEGQGNLACCSSRGHKESDVTEQLNNNSNKDLYFNKNLLLLKKTGQDDFQVHMNWEIVNVKLIPDINV